MKTIKGQVFDLIKSSGKKGKVAGELYKALPDVSSRAIRDALTALTNSHVINSVEQCRCGCSAIYTLK